MSKRQAPFVTEPLEWRKVDDEKPDADTTVMVYDPDLETEPVWPGAWDDNAGVWVVDGFECSPTHWAPMPIGPDWPNKL